MKILWLLLVSALITHAAPGPGDISGNWKGTLVINKAKLRLIFRIATTPEERLVAKLDSIDQGARDLPVDKVSFKDNTLHLELDFIKGSYEGKLQSDGKQIEGKWTQAGKTSPLTLIKVVGNESDDEEHLSGSDLAASKQAAQKLGGPWSGAIAAEGLSVPMTLRVTTNTAGAAKGVLDSPQLGLRGIPLTGLAYREGKVHFDAGGLGASYDGVSMNGNTSITGQWHQAEKVLPLSFNKESTSK